MSKILEDLKLKNIDDTDRLESTLKEKLHQFNKTISGHKNHLLKLDKLQAKTENEVLDIQKRNFESDRRLLAIQNHFETLISDLDQQCLNTFM